MWLVQSPVIVHPLYLIFSIASIFILVTQSYTIMYHQQDILPIDQKLLACLPSRGQGGGFVFLAAITFGDKQV